MGHNQTKSLSPTRSMECCIDLKPEARQGKIVCNVSHLYHFYSFQVCKGYSTDTELSKYITKLSNDTTE